MLSYFLMLTQVFAQQNVKLVNPDTYCKVESFSAQKGKVSNGNHKKCDPLKDKTDVPVKNMAACKERALKQGQACLKTTGLEELGVTAKFTEKFAVSFNATNFTCAVSKVAGSACP